MGSEKEIRNQSKKAIDQAKGGQGHKKNTEAVGPFNRSSFNDFTEKKFKEFLNDGSIFN